MGDAGEARLVAEDEYAAGAADDWSDDFSIARWQAWTERSIFLVGSTPRVELERFDLTEAVDRALPDRTFGRIVGIFERWLQVAYITLPEGNLWQSRADGSDRRELTFPPMDIGQPRWSPDGKQIAFDGAEPGKARKIYIISAEGGNPEQVTQGEQDDTDAEWSPNGDAIVFGGSYGWQSHRRSIQFKF